MTSKRRIYIVTNGINGETHLVRAISKQQAVSYLARNIFNTDVASQEDIVSNLTSGGQVLDAAAADDGYYTASGDGDEEPEPVRQAGDDDWVRHLSQGIAGDD